MSSPAERAHVWILEQRTLTVRTHEARKLEFERHSHCGFRPVAVTLRLHNRIMDIIAGNPKLTNKQISDIVGISPGAVGRHRNGRIKVCR